MNFLPASNAVVFQLMRLLERASGAICCLTHARLTLGCHSYTAVLWGRLHDVTLPLYAGTQCYALLSLLSALSTALGA